MNQNQYFKRHLSKFWLLCLYQSTYQHFLSYSVALTVQWEKEQGCIFQASKEFCTLYTKFYYYCVCGRYASYSFQFPLMPNFQQQSQIAPLGLQTSCSPGCPEAAVCCVLWERLINFASISHVYSPSLGFASIFSIFFPIATKQFCC